MVSDGSHRRRDFGHLSKTTLAEGIGADGHHTLGNHAVFATDDKGVRRLMNDAVVLGIIYGVPLLDSYRFYLFRTVKRIVVNGGYRIGNLDILKLAAIGKSVLQNGGHGMGNHHMGQFIIVFEHAVGNRHKTLRQRQGTRQAGGLEACIAVGHVLSGKHHFGHAIATAEGSITHSIHRVGDDNGAAQLSTEVKRMVSDGGDCVWDDH